MDFTSLLYAAENNKINSLKKSQPVGLKTKLSAPKKLERTKVNPKAVKALLDKKSQAEEKKRKEDAQKKEALLKARAEAKHNKKANAMARTTKDNVKVFTKEEMEAQRELLQAKARAIMAPKPKFTPKEQESKEKEKSKEPSQSKNKNRDCNKDKHSHNKDRHDIKHNGDREDKHKHKSKHKSKDQHEKREDGSKDKVKVDKNPKPKIVKRSQNAMPPPIDFKQLMQLASEKKDVPVPVGQVVVKDKDEIKKKKKIPDRPLTQEEKERFARTQTKEYQDWIKYGKPRPAEKTPEKKNNEEISVLAKKTQKAERSGHRDQKILAQSNKSTEIKTKTQSKSLPKTLPKTLSKGNEKPGPSKPESSGGMTQKRYLPGDARYNPELAKRYAEEERQSKEKRQAEKPSKYAEAHNNVLVCGPSRKRSYSEDEEEGEKPMSAWDRIYNQIPKKAKKPRQESDVEDDYEEYYEDDDGDLSDFIDDGPVAGEDEVSKTIREIFGYDKRKFRHEREDDINDMEVGFSQVMKEEARSARLGLKEDLEDIKEEEMRKKEKIKKFKRR